MVKFVDRHYDWRQDVLFWPDLATCHYANDNLAWLRAQSHGISFVTKEENPPNAPQIRPIENFWGILKMRVYDGNWTAKDRESLIRRIKKCIREMDMAVIVKMFNNLKAKVHRANQNGLTSLL